jgi:hypothetical protein
MGSPGAKPEPLKRLSAGRGLSVRCDRAARPGFIRIRARSAGRVLSAMGRCRPDAVVDDLLAGGVRRPARAEARGCPSAPCPPPSAFGRWLLLYLRGRAPAVLGRPPRWVSTVEHHQRLCEAGTGPAGARMGGAEKRSPPGRARSAPRELTRRPCPSAVSEANEASWAAGQEGEHRRGVGAKRRPPPLRAPAGPVPALPRRTSHAGRPTWLTLAKVRNVPSAVVRTGTR